MSTIVPKLRTLLCGWCGICFLLIPWTISCGQTRGSIKTDRGIYAEPPLPRLPRAGGKFFDSVFGTEIMRVTDETTAADGGTFYSYWPTFNCDNSRLLVKTANDGTAYIYKFDPATFTLGSRAMIPPGPTGYLSIEGAIWSGSDPDKLYGLIGVAIYAYHPSTQTFTLVGDFSGRFPRGDFLWQLSKSLDDEVFAFSRRHPNKQGGSDYVGYVVYQRSTNKMLMNQPVTANDLDEVQLDKSGRYLIVKGETKTTRGFSIIDLQNGQKRVQIGGGPPDYAPGHSDNGTGFISGYNNYLNTLDRRSFANPLPIVTEISFGQDWTQGLHLSQLADDESWLLVGSSVSKPASTPPGVFHNEIFQVRTDGSGQVRRLLHHRSLFTNYYDMPRANISRDGRFIAFTSNWGGTNHRDLFVALIQPPSTSPPSGRKRRVGRN